MSLKDKKSLYDRHTNSVLGNTVGGPNGTGPNPSAGNYFTNEGTSDSPFASKAGPRKDHMVNLLTNNVTSFNSNLTYKPSPNKSDFQDLDGKPGPSFGDAGGEGKKLGGKDLHEALLTKKYGYRYGDSTEVVGPAPGGDSNSDFQDLDGKPGPNFGDANSQGKKLGGKDLHEALLTKSYTYNTDPGKSTTILLRKSGAGGRLDLDGVEATADRNQGFFHGIANPQRFQGKKIGGVDLHEHLLEKIYSYSHGGGARIGTTPVTIGPSPGPSGFSDFQDLPGAPRTTSPLGYKNPDTGVSF